MLPITVNCFTCLSSSRQWPIPGTSSAKQGKGTGSCHNKHQSGSDSAQEAGGLWGNRFPLPSGPGPAHWSGSGHSSLGTVFPPQREAVMGKMNQYRNKRKQRTHWMGLYLRLGLRVPIIQVSWYHLCT